MSEEMTISIQRVNFISGLKRNGSLVKGQILEELMTIYIQKENF